METSVAMSILARAGRGDEVQKIVDQAVNAAQCHYREIDEDETRTPEYKRQELDQAYAKHRTKLNDKLAGLAQTVAQSEQRDAVRAFGTDDLKGDAASLAISRRDAGDRVAAVSQKETRDLLTRANRSGDEVLARAVAERALENLDDTTLHAFLADRPNLDPIVQRLWDAARAKNSHSGTFQNAMLLSGLRPTRAVAR